MALHKTLSKRLRMDIYFCDAYRPWQRGSNENANGIIREYLPKGIDLSPFTDQDLRKVEFVMNNTPRKILGFRTPEEVFSQHQTRPHRRRCTSSLTRPTIQPPVPAHRQGEDYAR